MNQFKTDIKVEGKDFQEFMADLLERNDKKQVEIEVTKQNVAIIKQMNNHSRILLDAAKYELKKLQAEKSLN